MKLISHPSFLLPWFPLTAGLPVGTYDSFINYLKLMGYRQGVDLFLFGYDWRQGVRIGATMLDDFIEHDVRSRHGGRPIVVAHSLGCLIVRWLVCHNPVYAQKIQLVVAAGPPVLGSARAFRSVIKMPDLTLWANRLYGLMRLLRRSNADRREMALTKSLMTVLSVLELMPPRDVPVIDEGTGPRSAFEWRGWPEVLLKIVDLALK